MPDWVDVREELDRSFYGRRDALYPSVLQAVRGLSALHAAWKPAPDQHSIWEIVDHLRALKNWRREMVESIHSWRQPPGVLLRGPEDVEAVGKALGAHIGSELSVLRLQMPPPWSEVSGDDPAWRAAVDRMTDAHERMKAAIEKEMWDRSGPQSTGPWPEIVYELAVSLSHSHDAFYAGQICYIRDLQGLPFKSTPPDQILGW